MRTLVLGGNRYIGLNLVFELARRGHEVTVINSHEVELPEGATRIHADRRVPGELAAALATVGEIDAVFDNTSYTVDDLRPVVEAFRGRVQHLMFTSSSAVYRRAMVQPVREHYATHDAADGAPTKAYGVGKVRCEQYLAAEYTANGLPYTVMRVGHTLGPKSPLVTRDPIFFARLEEGRPIFVPGDGFPFVQFVHVADVASAMASICGNARAVGQTYNIFGAEYASILNAVRVMAKAVGVEPNIVHVPLDIARRFHLVHWGEAIMGGATFSIDKAMAELDWTPRFGLEDGYRDSYDWFVNGGRDRYEYDFSQDDAVLEALA